MKYENIQRNSTTNKTVATASAMVSAAAEARQQSAAARCDQLAELLRRGVWRPVRRRPS